jgi:putative SOS response-associated peptidase YedK
MTYLKKPEGRCLAPVTSFAEPENRQGDDTPFTARRRTSEAP